LLLFFFRCDFTIGLRGINENEFVTMRNKRDATLAMSNLLLPSIQVNIRAGKLPPVETNGIAYFKIPVNLI